MHKNQNNINSDFIPLDYEALLYCQVTHKIHLLVLKTLKQTCSHKEIKILSKTNCQKSKIKLKK